MTEGKWKRERKKMRETEDKCKWVEKNQKVERIATEKNRK